MQRQQSEPACVNFQRESRVIKAKIDKCFNILSTTNFSWWSLIASVEGNLMHLGSNYVMNFKDGTKFEYRIVSGSTEKKMFVLELWNMEPQVEGVGAVIHTIKLREVTATAETLMEWSTDYQANVPADVVLDGKFKKLDALNDFAAAAEK